jgi:hypothetical protein
MRASPFPQVADTCSDESARAATLAGGFFFCRVVDCIISYAIFESVLTDWMNEMKENSHNELLEMMLGWCRQVTNRELQRTIENPNDHAAATYDVKTFADIKAVYVSEGFYRELVKDMRDSPSDFRLGNGSATFCGVQVFPVMGNHPKCVIA